MERRTSSRHHGLDMSTVAVPRARLYTGSVLLAAAVTAVVGYALLPAGTRLQVLASDVMVAASCLLSGGVILRAIGRGQAWPGSAPLAWLVFLVGGANIAFLLFDVQNPGVYEPRPTDTLLLLLLVPLALCH